MKKKTATGPKKRLRPFRLGIYGGTFDPVHHGHLLLARDVLEQLKFDAIVFVPCARSPFKHAKPHVTDAQRLALLRLALKGNPRFWLSRCELDRPAPSYAVDTAEEIRAAFPRAKLFWLIGADQLAELEAWHRPDDLRRLVTFVLLPRKDDTASPVPAGVLSLPQPRRIDISATEIRHRVKSGLPIDHLVPAPIAASIKRNDLYLS
jgi:nicotinate-nucleotide adenylyltransferase